MKIKRSKVRINEPYGTPYLINSFIITVNNDTEKLRFITQIGSERII